MPVVRTGALDVAAAALRAGAVVALPTDTVYGVAVALDVPGATGALFDLKRRPHDVDLPVLVDSVQQARRLADLDQRAVDLTDRFWPGPLTLVVPRRTGLDVDLGRSEGTVGLRCPDHDLVRALCQQVGPLATTSANLHGQPPAHSAAEVVAQLGDELLVIDGGECRGAPSTVVDATAPELRLLRQGAVPWESLTL